MRLRTLQWKVSQTVQSLNSLHNNTVLVAKKILAFLLAASTFLSFQPAISGQSYQPSEEDLRFLDLVEQKAFDFFRKEHHPKTGLVKDKANNFEKDGQPLASIAATGFGLSAMVVGADRGWISKAEAQEYCSKTLRFFLTEMESEHGFFYHFVDWSTGKKTNHTELSSIDTALFLAGALMAGEYFKGTEVERLADELYRRVNFHWMLNGGQTLSMGWNPREGFIKSRWDQYNESLILYILAIGSPTYRIPPKSWQRVVKRIGTYGSHVLIYSPPLFTHQYSACWLDLRNKNDGLADYFENSKVATIVNREFCLDQKTHYKTYSENVWGLTASISQHSYKAYGSEPGGAVHDGTVAPTAAGSSIVFTPELSIKALRFMYDNYKDRTWGRYGFSDAFNLDRNWYAKEVLGIDQGPLLLMIENFRSELLWRFFMKHPSVIRGMELAGFRPGTVELKVPEKPKVAIPRVQRPIRIDGSLDEWDLTQPLKLESPEHRELGEISGLRDLLGRFFFAWDQDFLYVAAKIYDDSLVVKKMGEKIWLDDIVELYFDPENDGIEWGNPKDVQLGLSPGETMGGGRSWAWFQGFDPAARGLVEFKIKRQNWGYNVEAKISWKLLNMTPQPNLTFGFSPAIHDIDQDGSEGKLHLFFLPEGKSKRNFLGEATLQ